MKTNEQLGTCGKLAANNPGMACGKESGHAGYCFFVPPNVVMKRIGDPGCTSGMEFARKPTEGLLEG